MGSSVRLSLGLLVIFVLALTSAEGDDVAVPNEDSEATSLVQAALQAELDGDASRRSALLRRALEREPNHLAARWQSGYLQVDDRWLTVEQAEQSTAKTTAVAEYRNLRDRLSGSLAGELSLARWCRKQGLQDQERFHWANALRFDSSNAEARGRLGVREFRGNLLTAEQIQNWKRGMQQHQKALREWTPKLIRWRREIDGSSLPHLTEAWRELTSLDDPAAVPSLEKIFYRSKLEFQRKVISVLGNIEDQIATDALVRLALNTDSSELRHAAATELGDRSWFGFVPNLMGRLETPVEYRYVVKTLGAGVVSEINFSKENTEAVVNVSHAFRAGVPLYIVPEQRTARNLVRMKLEQQRRIAVEASKQYRRIAESVQAVEQSNAQRIRFNDRVYSVLTTSTGQHLESQPRYWWDWWRDYNELDNSEEKPYVDFRRRREYDRPLVLRKLSCFLAGTPVWTESGMMAIEEVRRGDRVLTQDPDSGELSYRVVIDTTVRRPSPSLRIQVGDEQIVATLGHPIWVVGSGWKMAKHLQVGDQLHGVEGGVMIEEIEPGPVAEAYNLVVAETNTYFVGNNCVLVHDNMPRQATGLPLPGWLAVND